MGNANPMLYKVAAVAPSAFHDITTGDNTVYCVQGDPVGQPASILCPAPVAPDPNSKLGYAAATGYDLATGLGSVDVNNLAIAFKAPLPDFSVATNRSSLQTYPGGTAQATITITPINSLSQAISFSCSGLPTGASCSFNPATVTPPGTTSTVLTVQTSSSESGTSGFSVVATTGTLSQLTHSVAESLTVTTPTFTLTNTGSTSATVKAGVSGVGYGFTVAPAGGAATFAAAVTFACSGLDATTGCIFNPASIAQGAGSTPVTLTITTSGPNTGAANAQQHQRADNRLPWLPLTLPIAGLVMVGLAGRKVSRYSAIGGLCLALGLIGLLIACGSSTPISVTAVTPNSVSLWPNNAGWPSSTQAFTATVNNNTAVNWSLSPSGASSGSIDASGNYTAPQVAAGLPPTVTVKATSQVDSTKSNTATVTLKIATVPQTFNVTMTVTETTTMHTLPFTLVVQ
jgi:hypothetical protein